MTLFEESFADPAKLIRDWIVAPGMSGPMLGDERMRNGFRGTRPGRWRTSAGILLIVVGCLGFVTVADDLRHTGELFGVAAILAIGIVLVISEFDHPISRRLALHWVAVGVGTGVLVGAAIDNVPICVSCGAVLGTLGSAVMGTRRHRTPNNPWESLDVRRK